MKKEIKRALLVIIVEEIVLVSLILSLFISVLSMGPGATILPLTIFSNNFFLDILFIAILLPIYALIVIGIVNLILPIFIRIIKKWHRKNQSLVRIKVKVENNFKSNFIKSLYPALLALFLAIVINPYRGYLTFIFSPVYLSPGVPSAIFIMVFSFVLTPICTLIFALLWSLNGSGIFIIRKSKSDRLDEDFYIQNAGNLSLSYLKGFTGFGTIFSYSVIIFDLLNDVVFNSPDFLVNLILALLAGLLPLFLTLSITPGAVFNDSWIKNEHSIIENVLSDVPDGTESISRFLEKTK